METTRMSYKVKQFLLFAGVSTFIFGAVVIIPFIYGLYLTFTSWDGFSSVKEFVGIQNYITTFHDTEFWSSLLITFKYVFFVVIFVNVIAFFLAYILTSGIKGQKGASFSKTFGSAGQPDGVYAGA